MGKKKPTMGNKFDPKSEANDVLETAEMLRAANVLTRTSVGIISFANGICGAEVLSEDEMKSVEKAFETVFGVYAKVYASLMGRYSALSASVVGSEDEKPRSN